ncbi:long-chain fatty acid--CoA ligase, partial [Methylobacterium organophilum]|nr:long-chain fatty acid--CoA ligase [Methylobacterium organophilum]
MTRAATGPTNLGDLVDRSGSPDRPLIIGVDPGVGATVMTRADLDARADAFARGLVRGGIARGARLAILAANRPDTIAALLGAMRAGVVPVPVNHKFPPATIAGVLADCGARLVLCDGPRRDVLAGLGPEVRVAGFDDDGPEGFAAWLDPGPFAPIVPEPDEAALFLYTSGSTGRP